MNYVIPLYQCQNSKGRKFGKQEFRRCRDHQLDSDWCSVIFDVAGEPVQRRLQPLHALLERLNHWLRKLTHKTTLLHGVWFQTNASRSPNDLIPTTFSQVDIVEISGKIRRAAHEADVRSCDFLILDIFYVKIGLAFVFCLQKQEQCFKKHFKMGRLWAIMWSFSWLFFIIDNCVMYISIQCEFRHETKISQDSLQPFSESNTTPADVQINIYTLHQILPAYSNLCGLKVCLLYE